MLFMPLLYYRLSALPAGLNGLFFFASPVVSMVASDVSFMAAFYAIYAWRRAQRDAVQMRKRCLRAWRACYDAARGAYARLSGAAFAASSSAAAPPRTFAYGKMRGGRGWQPYAPPLACP